ncbi:hypothetical protein [Methanolobus sp.]|jgi:hypothetical protein|uniref:hypothetical protein n=1 Tax=Methanolobus sp. TaxID=1874737 RepID=UPI0025E06840|nr:hypothetical protein [Methanolobus sp.]
MQRSSLILVVVAVFALIVMGLFAMPFVFMGTPSPLFSLENKDINAHDVTIEIMDFNNNSIFINTYALEPDTRISQVKSNELIRQLSIPPGNSKETIVKVTLGNNITESRSFNLQFGTTVEIRLFENYDSPISIEVSSA